MKYTDRFIKSGLYGLALSQKNINDYYLNCLDIISKFGLSDEDIKKAKDLSTTTPLSFQEALYAKIAKSNPFDVITVLKQAKELNAIAYMIRYRKAVKYYRSIWYKIVRFIWEGR